MPNTLLGYAQALSPVGDGTPVVSWQWGFFLVLAALPAIALVTALGAWWRRRHPLPPRPALPTSTVLQVLAPMLMPLLALVGLRWLDVPAWWQERVAPTGRAGLLYYGMLPLFLPTAWIVAWGLDRRDGRPGHKLARVPLVLAVGTAIVAVAVLPEWIESLRTNATGSRTHHPSHGFASGIDFFWPFDTGHRDADGHVVRERLPLGWLLRGTAAMMLSVSLAHGGLDRSRRSRLEDAAVATRDRVRCAGPGDRRVVLVGRSGRSALGSRPRCAARSGDDASDTRLGPGGTRDSRGPELSGRWDGPGTSP